MPQTALLRDQATSMLQSLVGNADAGFHEGQFEAIEALVEGGRRALVVQRTGWGKSAVYFVASLLLRNRGAGPTLIVSPLLALMRDQVAAAARAGVRAEAINSANQTDWDDITAKLDANEVDVLLVSPERLNNPAFRERHLPELMRRTGLLVIDEAHCISDWGHDFRPDYRRLRELIAALPEGVPVLATTATANSRVVKDVEEQLGTGGTDVFTLRGKLARESLRLGVLRLPSPRSRLAWLLTHLDSLPGSGIIYALTVSAAEDTARLLRENGHAVRAYTGRTDPVDREAAEAALKQNEVKALIATSALGMGFDKPDLGFVVHLGAPSSPVAYYQQVGRAGRGTPNADVLLLPGAEDRDIWEYFATSSMPSEDSAQQVLGALEPGTVLSTPALEVRVNLKRSPLELLLKVLDVDGAVRKVSGGWEATGRAWVYDAERYRRISEARIAEQRAMLDYETTSACRMEFLARSLDDPTASPCGRCDNCAGPWYSDDIGHDASDNAGQALSRVGVELEPRGQWPSGMDKLGVQVKGKLKPGELAGTGRALARMTDLGWGNRLRELLADASPDAPLDPAVINACIRVLSQWNWDARPVAVVAMPSHRRPQLIGSLAQALAGVGKIPFLGVLGTPEGWPAGEPGGNSAFRLASVWDRFSVPAEGQAWFAANPGPVLLVDDLADSRWTITVAGRALRMAGAESVLPFALALRA
ncbi:ATP-dependent DNA helicase RecQ [Arthrobacter sp. CAN_A214]|uniref:RecQ family ATP-dependent DNA helicase n=1 Tax=Arthrobacter sp. CAN_A214 TaxID=2787720 RepID=UPI0018CBC549